MSKVSDGFREDYLWYVDNINDSSPSPFVFGMNYLSTNASREFHRFGEMSPVEANAIITTMMELVHYIGELQAELIAMQTTLDFIGGAEWHEDVPWVDDEPTH